MSPIGTAKGFFNPVTACFALATAAIAIAAFSPPPPARSVDPETMADRLSVVFRDEAGGAVGVYEAESGKQVGHYGFGEGGFVRATMRALAGDRMQAGGSADAPFELARTMRGQVMLRDPLTGKLVNLNAFGRDNANSFARLLDEGRTSR